MRRIYITNKKGDIGDTLTWMVALIIICFIMVLFITATIIFSTKKKIISGSDSINIAGNPIDMEDSRTLFLILNQNVFYDSQQILVKDLIFKWQTYDKNKITELLKNEIVKNIGNKCYIFDVKFSDSTLNIDTFESDSSQIHYDNTNLIDKASSIVIFSGDSRALVKFYSGECGETYST